MKTIAIDAGHGGHDGGAYGSFSKEKDIALSVSLLVADILRPYCKPFLTRASDLFLSLDTRPTMANNVKADAFISIHCNSADNASARGWEVFTTRGQNNSDKLADSIGIRYGAANPDLKTRFDESDGDIDKEANFTVIKGTNCPSCLLELGFISNKDEELLLNNEQFQRDSAAAIAYGLLDFLQIDIESADIESTLDEPTLEQRVAAIESRLDAAGF